MARGPHRTESPWTSGRPRPSCQPTSENQYGGMHPEKPSGAWLGPEFDSPRVHQNQRDARPVQIRSQPPMPVIYAYPSVPRGLPRSLDETMAVPKSATPPPCPFARNGWWASADGTAWSHIRPYRNFRGEIANEVDAIVEPTRKHLLFANPKWKWRSCHPLSYRVSVVDEGLQASGKAPTLAEAMERATESLSEIWDTFMDPGRGYWDLDSLGPHVVGDEIPGVHIAKVHRIEFDESADSPVTASREIRDEMTFDSERDAVRWIHDRCGLDARKRGEWYHGTGSDGTEWYAYRNGPYVLEEVD